MMDACSMDNRLTAWRVVEEQMAERQVKVKIEGYERSGRGVSWNGKNSLN